MLRLVSGPKARKGFTLVELAVVIVIIGVLAAFGVPRFLRSVEKSKAAEAFGYLSAVRSSQERYISQTGTYANDVTNLDIKYPALKYFTPGTVTISNATVGSPTWTLTLTRNLPCAYGAYTVIFNQDGFDTASTITGLADINPVDITGS
jgi:prepilin-type N-terminal cleavage/methylation domain-containing protein